MMADDLILAGGEAMAEVEFVGFETVPAAEAVPAGPVAIGPATEEAAKLRPSVKPRPRRAAKPRKRTHPVRVVFDDGEFLKLNLQAEAQGMGLSEYVRRSALHDARLRSREPAQGSSDLFARGKMMELTVVRLIAPLSPDLEQRINAYFSGNDRFADASPHMALPARRSVFVRLGQFFSELVGSRRPGGHATPSAGL
jgi:hypothetical protein